MDRVVDWVALVLFLEMARQKILDNKFDTGEHRDNYVLMQN